MPRVKMSFDEWFKEYEPLTSPEGDLIDCDPRCHNIPMEAYDRAFEEKRVWVQLDSQYDDPQEALDNHEVFIVSYPHFVDITRVLITKKAIPKNHFIEVYED